MPGHGSDHPSPFWAPSACAAPGKTVTSEPAWTYQNFRKGRYQNFRNPRVLRRDFGTLLWFDVACNWPACVPRSRRPPATAALRLRPHPPAADVEARAVLRQAVLGFLTRQLPYPVRVINLSCSRSCVGGRGSAEPVGGAVAAGVGSGSGLGIGSSRPDFATPDPRSSSRSRHGPAASTSTQRSGLVCAHRWSAVGPTSAAPATSSSADR
jgi:hypothetical protein